MTPLAEHWPLFRLRLRSDRLELRLPTDEDLAALVACASGGVHPPEVMPFATPWTDLPPGALERGVETRFVLDREGWRARDRPDVALEHVEGCRELFGAAERVTGDPDRPGAC